MIFDTHTHYDDEAYDCDRDVLLMSMAEHGIGRICNIGSTYAGARESARLSEKYDFMYAAVGVHPDELHDLDEDGEEKFRSLGDMASGGRVVAIGEIGLDYHGFDRFEGKPGKEMQKYWFKRQLELAIELGLPVVIHSRNAAADTLELLARAHDNGLRCAVIHCYSYSMEFAEKYIDMGFYLGFGGTITYEGQKKITKALQVTPPERILLETDCPYLTPMPLRAEPGNGRNTSLNLPYVVRKISEIKEMDPAETERITWDNANRFYGIADSD